MTNKHSDLIGVKRFLGIEQYPLSHITARYLHSKLESLQEYIKPSPDVDIASDDCKTIADNLPQYQQMFSVTRSKEIGALRELYNNTKECADKGDYQSAFMLLGVLVESLEGIWTLENVKLEYRGDSPEIPLSVSIPVAMYVLGSLHRHIQLGLLDGDILDHDHNFTMTQRNFIAHTSTVLASMFVGDYEAENFGRVGGMRIHEALIAIRRNVLLQGTPQQAHADILNAYRTLESKAVMLMINVHPITKVVTDEIRQEYDIPTADVGSAGDNS